jgi:hypothetical protein
MIYGFWLRSSLPYHDDILTYVYPEKSFTLESLRAGRIPLWDPYLSCGIPHLANWQSAVFYPPFWLLGVLGLSRGLVWLVLLHQAWAFAGFYLWARQEKIQGWVGALGALAFAGSASMVLFWTNLTLLTAASWIPWVFLAVRLALRQRRPLADAAALAVLCLQLLAGYPLFVFYTWLILAGWVLFQRPRAPHLTRLVLLGGSALILTAFQWLPFLELMTFTSHGGWSHCPFYTHTNEYLTFLRPTALGVNGGTGYRSDSFNALFANFYFGLLPCFFAAASILALRKTPGYWKAATVLLLAVMAGPSLTALQWVPNGVWNLLEPSKAMSLFVFTACAGFCFFLNSLSGGPKLNNRWLTPAVFITLLCCGDIFLIPFSLIQRVPDPYQDPGLSQQAAQLSAQTENRRFLSLGSPGELRVVGRDWDETSTKLARVLVDQYAPNSNMVWGLRSVSGYFSLQTKALGDFILYLNRGFPYRGDLLDVAGVRVFFMPQPLPAPKYQSLGIWGKSTVSLSPTASPDLRWVGQALLFPSHAAILERLAYPDNPWTRKVYFEKIPGNGRVGLAPASRSRTFPKTAGASHSRGSLASFESRAHRPGFVVFNESYTPGWHAWVDGTPQPIFRAYGLFMAVAVEAGDHQVDFRYEPASFRFGLFVSLMAFGAAVLVLRRLPGIFSPDQKKQ